MLTIDYGTLTTDSSRTPERKYLIYGARRVKRVGPTEIKGVSDPGSSFSCSATGPQTFSVLLRWSDVDSWVGERLPRRRSHEFLVFRVHLLLPFYLYRVS